jgi:1-deoxy-D-xylulose-5-phosphate reductoisomerase
MKTVTVLGSTGSIGRSTADLLAAHRERYRVLALVANKNAEILAEQAKHLGAELAVCSDPSMHKTLQAALAGTGIRVACGEQAVMDAARLGADWTMAAITGIAGLAPTLAAAERGGAIALANKEAVVSAGDVMLRAVRDAGATLLPVDSEHNAIFQSLAGSPRDSLEKIILTASGGPFRLTSVEDMARATPETALKHPVWSMGAKISIDSATLFNKGLEVIEAARLFALDPSQIEVLVHPQSVIHGMVCYRDGSVLAQMGAPDMRIPIAHTLAWPERIKTNSPRLDLATIGRLDFLAPDEIRFPALRIARQALQDGGGAPTIMNAANEIAVAAFLNRRIGFLQIAEIVEATLDRLGPRPADSLPLVASLDAEARRIAGQHVQNAGERSDRAGVHSPSPPAFTAGSLSSLRADTF